VKLADKPKNWYTMGHVPVRARCVPCDRIVTGLAMMPRRKKFLMGYCSHCRGAVILRPYLAAVKTKAAPGQSTLSTPPNLTLVR
jgi:hypothetical protein